LARSFVRSRRSARTGAESRETGRAGTLRRCTLAPADTDVDAIISQNGKVIFKITGIGPAMPARPALTLRRRLIRSTKVIPQPTTMTDR
jgi:hypothetical protein